MGAKRAKIAVIVVLFGAAAYVSYAYLMRSGPMKNSIRFVCAATGEEFWLSRSEVIQIPMNNPKTKEETLLPCGEAEDGTIRVDEHYRAALEQIGEKNKFVDMTTLVVKQPG